MMRINCIIDNTQYKSKPSGPDYAGINNRMKQAQEQQLTVVELAHHIENGCTYLAGHFIDRSIGRKKENIKNINIFSLDIDNKYTEDGKDVYTNYNIGQVIGSIAEFTGATPLIIYTTYSKENEANNSPRFRLIYGLDKVIDHEGLELLQEHIINKFPTMFDQACKDASRLFLGTCNEVMALEGYTLLDTSIINKLKEEKRQADKQRAEELEVKRQARKSRKPLDPSCGTGGFNDDIIDELKSLDISDYLVSQGYTDIEKCKDGYKMPCPIHGGRNKNFFINNINGAWLYKCFSKCGGDGGSIIDLHAELNNLDLSAAISELKEIYGMETPQPKRDNVETYSIDKYIGQDKDATRGILEAIQGHKRTLITGAMGAGKTHFIFNNVYEYAKSINKTLVAVIPGVNQLNNLSQNKGISIVNMDSPVYFGNDRVAVTPDSLHKVLAELKPDSYILVVDESHERYTSLYRASYRDKRIEHAEKNAYRTIHLTATPRLLAYEGFGKVINIVSRNPITNNIYIMPTNKKVSDVVMTLTKKQMAKGNQVIVFNNNKEENKLYARTFKEEIVTETYALDKEQLSIFLKDSPRKQVMEIITSTETVSSEDKSDNIQAGKVAADLTCMTSAVLAGIDLYTEDNAVLIVNTRGLGIDSLIQLIGRFREGIRIVLVTQEPERLKNFFNIYDRIAYNLENANRLITDINTNRYGGDFITQLLSSTGGVSEKAFIIYNEEAKKWEVDQTALIASVNKLWSEAAFENIDQLIKIMKSQDAFKVNEIKRVKEPKEIDTTISELKKLTAKEKKEQIKKTSEYITKLPDEQINKMLTKDYTDLDEHAEVFEAYREAAAGHLEKIKVVGKRLFETPNNEIDLVGAFKHFYSNSWVSIKKELEALDAREVNKIIKKHGTDFFLGEAASFFKQSYDVVQAKIRDELQDLEKKQGRISKKRLEDLTQTLYKEKYIYNNHVKILNTSTDKTAKEKALECLKDTIRARIGLIYNLTEDGRISSIKE